MGLAATQYLLRTQNQSNPELTLVSLPIIYYLELTIYFALRKAHEENSCPVGLVSKTRVPTDTSQEKETNS